MPMTVEQLVEEALALSTESRVRLVEQLADSLHDSAPDERWQELWVAEAQRRLADIRSGRVQTISGEEALARVRHAAGQ